MRRIVVAGILLAGALAGIPAMAQGAPPPTPEPFPRCVIRNEGSSDQAGFIENGTCRPLAEGEAWSDDPCYQGSVPIYTDGVVRNFEHGDNLGCPIFIPPDYASMPHCFIIDHAYYTLEYGHIRDGFLLNEMCIPLPDGQRWPYDPCEGPGPLYSADGRDIIGHGDSFPGPECMEDETVTPPPPPPPPPPPVTHEMGQEIMPTELPRTS